MELKYTICFIHQNDEMLLLYRLKNPNIHKWNGVGGKIEEGETPRESVIREVKEETGLTIEHPIYKGIVSWNNIAGMYVYLANEINGKVIESDEGPLEWKSLEWIKTSSEIVSNIPVFLNHLLNNDPPKEYAFSYNNGVIMNYKILPINEDENKLNSQIARA
jgi:8-oxo-dGTP diphosphatase